VIETRVNGEGEASKELLRYLDEIKSRFAVSRLASISGFVEESLGVAIAYRPNSKVLSQSGGKGVTQEQAYISALMESFECHTAEEASWGLECKERELKGRVCSVDRLAITMIDYTKDSKERWSTAVDMVTKEEVYIPFDSISLDFRRMTNPRKRGCFYLSSNGLASGMSWEDACKSGLNEVIERHCITLNEQNGVSTRMEVDPQILEEGKLKVLRNRLRVDENISIGLYDNTVWDAFPTYKCLISDGMQAWCGYGTYTDGVIAATRAITEAHQARVISISGSREDMNKDLYLTTFPRDKVGKAVKGGVELREGTLGKDASVQMMIDELLREHGESMYVYTYDQIDERIHVVRVIVEGLHGYNYNGYRNLSRLGGLNLESASVVSKEIHSPAAG